MNDYFNGNIPEGKGIKGIITGPSTIVYSSRIESFYKHKEDAILDLARSLKHEVEAIEKRLIRFIFKLMNRFYLLVWLI